MTFEQEWAKALNDGVFANFPGQPVFPDNDVLIGIAALKSEIEAYSRMSKRMKKTVTAILALAAKEIADLRAAQRSPSLPSPPRLVRRAIHRF